jgi:hypothetical protein
MTDQPSGHIMSLLMQAPHPRGPAEGWTSIVMSGAPAPRNADAMGTFAKEIGLQLLPLISEQNAAIEDYE